MKHSMGSRLEGAVSRSAYCHSCVWAILLLLKGMKSVANLVRPFTAILPRMDSR